MHDGYVYIPELLNAKDFCTALAELSTDDSHQLPQRTKDCIRNDIHGNTWFHQDLALALLAKINIRSGDDAAAAITAYKSNWGRNVLELGQYETIYDLNYSLHSYFRELDSEGYFECYNLQIVSISIHPGNSKSNPTKIVIKYVSTLHPQQIQNLLDMASVEFEWEEAFPPFIWCNLKNTWT